MPDPAIMIDRPYRRKQTATIEINAAPDAVFALMCPVREYEWEPDWSTRAIFSNSGLVEEDCVFITPKGASSGGADATWITPVYDKKRRQLTMYKLVPEETVTRLDIAVDETKSGAAARVSYELTALSAAGKPYVDGHTNGAYREMMQSWKTAIEGIVGAKPSAKPSPQQKSPFSAAPDTTAQGGRI